MCFTQYLYILVFIDELGMHTQQSHGRIEWKNILLKAKEHMTILLKH